MKNQRQGNLVEISKARGEVWVIEEGHILLCCQQAGLLVEEALVSQSLGIDPSQAPILQFWSFPMSFLSAPITWTIHLIVVVIIVIVILPFPFWTFWWHLLQSIRNSIFSAMKLSWMNWKTLYLNSTESRRVHPLPLQFHKYYYTAQILKSFYIGLDLYFGFLFSEILL